MFNKRHRPDFSKDFVDLRLHSSRRKNRAFLPPAFLPRPGVAPRKSFVTRATGGRKERCFPAEVLAQTPGLNLSAVIYTPVNGLEQVPEIKRFFYKIIDIHLPRFVFQFVVRGDHDDGNSPGEEGASGDRSFGPKETAADRNSTLTEGRNRFSRGPRPSRILSFLTSRCRSGRAT